MPVTGIHEIQLNVSSNVQTLNKSGNFSIATSRFGKLRLSYRSVIFAMLYTVGYMYTCPFSPNVPVHYNRFTDIWFAL